MYNFQGIKLKAYASFRAGSAVTDEVEDVFSQPSSETVTTTGTTSVVSGQTNLGDPTWERILMREEGSQSQWQEI